MPIERGDISGRSIGKDKISFLGASNSARAILQRATQLGNRIKEVVREYIFSKDLLANELEESENRVIELEESHRDAFSWELNEGLTVTVNATTPIPYSEILADAKARYGTGGSAGTSLVGTTSTSGLWFVQCFILFKMLKPIALTWIEYTDVELWVTINSSLSYLLDKIEPISYDDGTNLHTTLRLQGSRVVPLVQGDKLEFALRTAGGFTGSGQNQIDVISHASGFRLKCGTADGTIETPSAYDYY